MKETSEVKVTEKEDGTIELFFANRNIDAIGGGDFICTYKFDDENSARFRSELTKLYSGSLQEMVEEAFTERFNLYDFYVFCKKHGIVFDKSIRS